MYFTDKDLDGLGEKINNYTVEEVTQKLAELSNVIFSERNTTDKLKVELDILKAKLFEQSKEESKLSDSRTDNVVTTNLEVIELTKQHITSKNKLEHFYRFYDIHLNILKLKTK